MSQELRALTIQEERERAQRDLTAKERDLQEPIKALRWLEALVCVAGQAILIQELKEKILEERQQAEMQLASKEDGFQEP